MRDCQRQRARRHALLLAVALLGVPAAAGAWQLAGPLSDASWLSAQAKLADVLGRREFQEATPSPVTQWLEARLEDLLRLLGRNLPDGLGQGETLNILLGALSILLIAAVLIYAFRSLFADFAQSNAFEEQTGETATLTAGTALQQAQTLSAGGDYRSAVRYLYLSCLFSLEERGRLTVDRTLTNREVLNSVADQPAMAGLLRDVVDIFDRVWYGFERIGETAYRRYEVQVQALQKPLEERPHGEQGA